MTKGNESTCHQLRREASIIRNEKGEINYHTMYQKMSAKKIRRTVNVKGEPTVNGGKCTMERTSPRPRTVTPASTVGQLINTLSQVCCSVKHVSERPVLYTA